MNTGLPIEAAVGASSPSPEGSFVLRGGWIVDGTSAPPFRADVAVEDGIIRKVGRIGDVAADRVVDCTGLFIMPGMVDTHVHGESAVFKPEVQAAMLAQGVTSIIIGQDGLSSAPAHPATRAYVEQYFGSINGDVHLDHADFLSIDDVLTSYEGATPINVGTLIPRGNVQHEVLGTEARPATKDELEAMRRLVAEGMEQGALGLSTGLEYIPDRYGSTDEIADLVAEVGRHGGVYVTHMRGYEAAADIGVIEAREIGVRSGTPVHLSHFHGPFNMLRQLVDETMDAGVDLTYDSYPYTRGATIVAMVGVPPWLQLGGMDACLERLRDPAIEDEWRQWAASNASVFSRIRLAQVESDEFRWSEGHWLEEAAALDGSDVVSFLRRLLVSSKLRSAAVFDQPRTNTMNDVIGHFQHPAHMVGSDSIYLGGAPHPRGWGTFARFLGLHTREQGHYTWGEASQHLSAHACRRFGLGARGLVRPGMVADLVALDPRTVADRSTYEEPRVLARGVMRVWVGGQEVFRDGAVTGRTPGSALRLQ